MARVGLKKIFFFFEIYERGSAITNRETLTATGRLFVCLLIGPDWAQLMA
jgi:hypothetical protein